MKRRSVLTGLAGLGLTGASAWVVTGGLSGGGERSGLPETVETIEAPGSSSGQMEIPSADSPTLVDLFATWCGPCVEQMASLGTVHEEYGSDVAFVSVTNERLGNGLTREDLRQWWREHDGAWTMGHDPESDLMSALGASGLPFLALFDAEGEVVWTHAGVASPETLRTELDRVR